VEKFTKKVLKISVVEEAPTNSSTSDSLSSAGSISSRERTPETPKSREKARAASAGIDLDPSIGNKKKRVAFRHALMNGKSPAEREKIDHSLKMLDTHLPEIWHRKRYSRRLRAILKMENPWHSRSLYLRGTSLYLQMIKDSKVPNNQQPNDMEWYEYRVCSGILLNGFLNGVSSSVTPEMYQTQNYSLIDMIQSFVQSIVLASRSDNHLQVFKYSKELWNVLRYCINNGKFNHEFWKLTLWRGLESAGIAILNSLNSIRIRLFNTKDSFSEESTSEEEIIFKGLMQLHQEKYIGEWIDELGGYQTYELDVGFCSEFLLFTIETMFLPKKLNRIRSLQTYMNTFFGDIHDHLINPLILGVPRDIEIMKDMNNYTTDELWGSCRSMAASLLIDKIQHDIQAENISTMYKKCIIIYEYTLEKVSSEKSDGLRSALCNEFGDFLFEIGNQAGAAVYWSKSIGISFKTKKFLKKWQTLLNIDIKTPFEISDAFKVVQFFGGIRESIFVAKNLSKLARFVYHTNQDKNMEIVWLASHIILSCLFISPNQPFECKAYTDFSCTTFLKNEELFLNKYDINPAGLVEELNYLSSSLIQMHMTQISFPLLSLAESICHNLINSIQLSAIIKLVKAEALFEMGMINEGISLFINISRKISGKRNEELAAEFNFENSSFPLTPQHFSQLKTFINYPISEKAKSCYTQTFVFELELAKVNFVLDIVKWTDLNMFVLFGENNEEGTQQKETYQSYSNSLLAQCKISLLKQLTSIQQQIKSKSELTAYVEKSSKSLKEWEIFGSLHVRLFLVYQCLSQVCKQGRNFKDAIKWY
jgi:hypothetical protein